MHRGEIWLINLEPTVGAEIHKTRLVVNVNDDAIGILPLSEISLCGKRAVPVIARFQILQNVEL